MDSALLSSWVQDGRGIFASPNWHRSIAFSGALLLPADTNLSEPLTKFLYDPERSRVSKESYCPSRFLRGPRYVCAINKNLGPRHRLAIFVEDFSGGISAVIDTLKSNEELRPHALVATAAALDYSKNAVVTLFNALVYREKVGDFRLADEDYQSLRKALGHLVVHTTASFYEALTCNNVNKLLQSCEKLLAQRETIFKAAKYLEESYLAGVFSSRALVRPEAGHPLIILASSFLVAERSKPIDTILGFPAGGTELACCLHWTNKILNNQTSNIYFLPISVHSAKEIQDLKGQEENSIESLLNPLKTSLEGKNVVLYDDNSSTGKTLQQALNGIFSVAKPHNVTVAVAEADLIRSLVDLESSTRTVIANRQIYAHAAGVLPVSKVLKPKHDLRGLMERRDLIKMYQEKLKSSSTIRDRIMYESFVNNLEHPIEEVLGETPVQAVISDFHGTFLSNFYAQPVKLSEEFLPAGFEKKVTYTFPSVEHAYQAAKFPKGVYDSFLDSQLKELHEVLKKRGLGYQFKSIEEIFHTDIAQAGTVKLIADKLRDWHLVRPDWEVVRVPLMADLLVQKFTLSDDLATQLKATAPAVLVEGNTWNDTFWGVCEGRGHNLLGRLLMGLRKHLMEHSLNKGNLS